MPEETTKQWTGASATADFAREAREIEKSIKSKAAEQATPSPKTEEPSPATTPDKPVEPNKAAEPTKPAETPKPPEKTKEELEKEFQAELAKAPSERRQPRDSKEWSAYKEADKKRHDQLSQEREQEKTKLQQERDTIVQERETLKKQLDGVKGNVPPDEVQRLQKEREDLKKELEEITNKLNVVAVQENPKFKGWFESETNKRIKRAQVVVGPQKAVEVERILRMPEGNEKEEALSELTADMSEFKKHSIENAIESLGMLDIDRQEEIEKWRTKGTEMEAARQAKEREALEQQAKQNELRIDEILTQLPSDATVAPFLDQEVARISKAAILGGIKDQKDLVATIVRGIGFRKVLEARQQLIQEKTDAEAAWTKERDELKAQIAALEGAQPAGGTTAASTAVAKEGIDEDKIPDNIQSPDALAKWTSGQVKKWTSGR